MPAPEIILAGNIGIDLIPAHASDASPWSLTEGGLASVGNLHWATGGSVANVGRALFRLGAQPRLIAAIGNDPLGEMLKKLLAEDSPELIHHLITKPESDTCYTIVINPPHTDRTFLHFPGVNDQLTATDFIPPIEKAHTTQAPPRILHFGYPPVMKSLLHHHGAELKTVLEKASHLNLLTSLDMASIDPHGASGKIDWLPWLKNILPHVTLFCPSLPESLDILKISEPLTTENTLPLAHRVSKAFLDLGCSLTLIKLGDQGIYFRSSAQPEKINPIAQHLHLNPDHWLDQEKHTPCFPVTVAGTTGAGDATIAGFLHHWNLGKNLDACLTAAVATGAHCVESPDAVSAIPSWSQIKSRINNHWKRKQS